MKRDKFLKKNGQFGHKSNRLKSVIGNKKIIYFFKPKWQLKFKLLTEISIFYGSSSKKNCCPKIIAELIGLKCTLICTTKLYATGMCLENNKFLIRFL